MAWTTLLTPEQALRAPLDPGGLGQRDLELVGQHLDADHQVGAVGPEARRIEVERRLVVHGHTGG